MLNFITNKIPLSYQQVALLVSVQGSVDKLSHKQFEKQFQDYLQVGFHFLIMDCSGIKTINSSGLQVLLKTVEMFHEAGGVFLFIRVLPQISKFFDMLGFTPIFTSFTRQEEAVAYLEEQIRKSVFANSNNSNTVIMSSNSQSIQTPHQSHQQMRPPTTSVDISRGKALNYPGSSKNIVGMSGTESLSVLLEIQSHKKMVSKQLYPIILTIMSIQGKKEPPILNVVPYFPGCSIVPEYRAIYLAPGQQTCFWVTPMLDQNIPAWFEIWCGDENIQQLLLPVNIISMRIVKILWFVAGIFFATLLTLPLFARSNLYEWSHACQNFITNSYPFSYIFVAGIMGLAIFLQIYLNQKRPVTIQQRFEFE